MAEIIFICCKPPVLLVDKEDFFIIFQGIMKKTNVVCNNQNSLERAIFINTHGICQYRAEES